MPLAPLRQQAQFFPKYQLSTFWISGKVSIADILRKLTEPRLALPPGQPDFSRFTNIRLKVGI